MNDDANNTVEEGAAVRFPPPLVYLIAMIVGVLAQAFVAPLHLDFSSSFRIGGAVVIACISVPLMASAISLFNRSGQDPKPWAVTPEIITSGIYRFTRNPMYVGMALLQVAVGVGLASGWILAFVPIVLVIVYVIAVRHEESYLEQKFGSIYTDYRASVRRWI